MPARLTSLTALTLLACALLLPAAASAQSSPFTPLPQPAPQQETVVVPQPEDDGDGLTDTQQLLIGLAGFVLLGGIAWAILRDARSAAPTDGGRVDPLAVAGEEGHHRGTRAPKQQRVKSNRSKAKAARQARKRNR